MKTLRIDNERLSLNTFNNFLFSRESFNSIAFSEETLQQVTRSHHQLLKAIEKNKARKKEAELILKETSGQ